MADRHLRRGQDEYWYALRALLPQGIAWPREVGSTLQSIVRGLAGIMGFCDGRADDFLVRESDPRTTVELLPEWERAWGLPDPCYTGPVSIGERQRALVLRMTFLGGASRAFFISVAKYLGYDVSITEYRPFMVGIDRCGDNRTIDGVTGAISDYPCQIGDATMRFAWTMNVHAVRLTWFRASQSQAGIDPHLRINLALDLECVIRRWRPAHTDVLFNYSGLSPQGDHLAGTP
jgi:uncharacterized protein YmfQ (DUF2313 family)